MGYFSSLLEADTHIAMVQFIQAETLDWLDDAGFYDCLSTGQQGIEWDWRLQRSALTARRRAQAHMQQFAALPDEFNTLHLTAQERKVLMALWAANPQAVQTPLLCALLGMNPNTRTLFNLISRVNLKCKGTAYRIAGTRSQGYQLQQQI